jgi:hypothetical protein
VHLNKIGISWRFPRAFIRARHGGLLCGGYWGVEGRHAARGVDGAAEDLRDARQVQRTQETGVG